MTAKLTQEQFLEVNRISSDNWKKANIGWDVLCAIADDHQKQSEHLEQAAELIANKVQKSPSVHSVRWRVKHSDHLLEKIIRKRAEGNTKYSDISPDNYFEYVTDLVGVRAIHLFKTDCFAVDAAIRDAWPLIEGPIAFIREGDSESLRKQFQEQGFGVKEHPAGYRSVHYVIQSTPMKRPLFAEVQVRTIFEEGWSEIDHTVRYPNFSDNNLVEYFLQIFNRLAGSADDMGGFVVGLVTDLNNRQGEILSIKKEKEETLQQMDDLLSQLESAKEQDKESREHVAKLKREINKLRAENDRLGLQGAGLLGLGNAISDRGGLSALKRGLMDTDVIEQAKRGIGLRGLLDPTSREIGLLSEAVKGTTLRDLISKEGLGLIGSQLPKKKD